MGPPSANGNPHSLMQKPLANAFAQRDETDPFANSPPCPGCLAPFANAFAIPECLPPSPMRRLPTPSHSDSSPFPNGSTIRKSAQLSDKRFCAIHHSRPSSSLPPTERMQYSPGNASHVISTQHGRPRVRWDAELHQRRQSCLVQRDRQDTRIEKLSLSGAETSTPRTIPAASSQSIVDANGFAKHPSSETP
jgi:hypothetical protein